MGGMLRAPPLLLFLILCVSFVSVTAASSLGRITGSGPTPRVPSSPASDTGFNYTRLVRQGSVLSAGGSTGFDQYPPLHPTVLHDGGIYRMWYFAGNGSTTAIGYATSVDGRSWTKQGIVLSPSLPSEGPYVEYPAVLKVGGLFWMYYDGYNGTGFNVLAATSSDGLSWTKLGVVLSGGSSATHDSYGVLYPTVVYSGGNFSMFYSAIDSPTGPGNSEIARATSTDGLNWTKQGVVLTRGSSGSPDAYTLFASAVDIVGSGYQMVYCGNADGSTTYFLYAQSSDGISWQKKGVALATSSPNETLLSFNSFLVNATGGWWMWYNAEGSNPWQVYLAISDSTPPVTTPTVVGTQGLDGWFVSIATVYLNATDDLSGVSLIRYSLDTGPWTNYSAPLILAEGSHTIGYQALDRSGNWESLRLLSVRVDSVAPISTLRLQGKIGNLGWYDSAVTVTLNATDETSGVANILYQSNGGLWTTYTGPFSLPDGQYLFAYMAVDAAGNLEPAHLALIRVDSTSPVVTITSPGGILTHSDVTISWTGSDAASGIGHYEVSIDGGSFLSVGTSNSAAFPLADGAHDVRVKAFDVAGNEAISEVRFNVDTNAFSPSGPYSGVPSYLIILAALGIAFFVVWRRRRSKPAAKPPTPP